METKHSHEPLKRHCSVWMPVQVTYFPGEMHAGGIADILLRGNFLAKGSVVMTRLVYKI